MRYWRLLPLLLVFLYVPQFAHAQLWSGILNPTSGTGACTVGNTSTPDRCAIDWSTAGIAGGLPSSGWTQSGSGISASACGNGVSDCTSTIQTALNGCGTDHYVLLGGGTFLINSNLDIPSNCVLRGLGANQTILTANGTSGNVINIGTNSQNLANWPSIAISSGATAGSTSITLASLPSGSSITAGTLIIVNELNPSWVSINGSEGTCNWCDSFWNGTRAIGQTDLVDSVSGDTLTLDQPLFISYPNTPLVTPLPTSDVTQYAGVENLQVYANNTGYLSNFNFSGCAFCWVSGIEGNYADGNQVQVQYSYHDEVVNSYFSNAFSHSAGGTDSDVAIQYFSSGTLVQNNILERLHVSVMEQWGPSGNVVAYNYAFGNFHSPAPNFMINDLNTHGAHPLLNLWEGNIATQAQPDNIWGSSSDGTFFRNWIKGATLDCNPVSGRSTVVCSPIGTQGNTGINGWWPFQAVRAMDIDFLTYSYNLIGDVIGSSDMANLVDTNTSVPLAQVNMVVALCGPSPCGAVRSYDADAYAYSFGYAESSDTGANGTANGAGCDGPTTYTCHSLVPYSTTFLHGEYSEVTGQTTWATGVTQTLPASFYLPSKPSWFGNVPWPPIGPDVTGGIGPGGHAYAIPAEVCYEKVMGGTVGTGSPLTFNANACYGGSSISSPPAPPTKPTAIAQ